MTSPIAPVVKTLAPLSQTQFLDQYWEQQPLHIARDDPSYFCDLVTSASIDLLLSAQDVYFPQVQLTQSGTSIPVSDYADTTQKILPTRLLNLHDRGATVIVSQANRLLSPLNAFCRSLQASLGNRCQANVYLSPPGSQGFNPHYDSHDVFILQVSGQKTFRFYAGGQVLPLNRQRFDPELATCGELKRSITLNPGDTLYIPRGMMHDALAEGNEASLHVTVGVFTVTLVDLLEVLLNDAAEQHQPLRESLSLFDSDTGSVTDTPMGLMAALNSSLSAMLTESSVRQALTALQHDVALELPQDGHGLLSRLALAKAISLQTTVSIRQSKILSLNISEGQVELLSAGQVLTFHGASATAVRWIVKRSTLVVGDIPRLTDDEQITLVQRLVRENLADLHTTT